MKISEVIVVEGKNDIMRVSEAVDAFIVSTSGSGITKDLLKMLKKLHNEVGIVVLMDPDGPGERIRSIIAEQIPGANHAFIKKSDAILNNDVGIENASVDSIRKALENIVSYSESSSDLEMSDLLTLKLLAHPRSKEFRERLCDSLDITYCNGKTLLKRLKFLNISREKLEIMIGALDE